MSDLYGVGFLGSELVSFPVPPSTYDELPDLTLYEPLFRGRPFDRAAAKRDPSFVRRWTAERLAHAPDTVLAELVELALRGCTVPCALAPREILGAMARPRANVWEACIDGILDSDVSAGRALVEVQGLLHDALPARFAAPMLARVELEVSAVHPDIRAIEVDWAMAARLLMDSSLEHPLRRYFPVPSEPRDAYCDIVFGIEILERTTVSSPELVRLRNADSLPEIRCAFCVPAHLVGGLAAVSIWTSAAFPGE